MALDSYFQQQRLPLVALANCGNGQVARRTALSVVGLE